MATGAEEGGSKRKSVEYSDVSLFDDGSEEPPRKKFAVPTGDQNGIAAVVANHYNNVEEKGKAARTESRIFYMRNFNNWIKSNLIAEFLEKVRSKKEPIHVLDLGCGKGGDLLKWKKGEISKLVGVDVADVSVQQAKERYQTLQKQQRNIFEAEFHCVDCCKDSILNHVEDDSIRFDLTSCQFVYNYSFDTYPRAEAMLTNACRYLKVGGFFIGTMPNANEVMKRLKMSDSGDEFGNDVFKVKMTTPINWPEGRNVPPEGVVPIFGAEYNFSLESVVDCPEYLVHFGTFKKMAEKHGMKLVYAKRFPDYAKQVLEFDPQSRPLMQRMNALESFPAEGEKKLVGTDEFDYTHADEHVKRALSATAVKEEPAPSEDATNGDDDEDAKQNERRKVTKKVGTLSKSEWDAVTLYMVFAFQKISEPA